MTSAIRRRSGIVTACLMVLATLVVGSPARQADAALAIRPDARIRRSGSTTLVGNDIYGLASLQTVQGSVRFGGNASYVITLQNDGTSADRYRVRAGGNSRAFWVAYREGAGRDVTAQVVAGTYTTPSVAAGGRAVLVATVWPTGTDDAQRRTLTMTSVTQADRADTVGFRTSTNVVGQDPSVAYWRLPTTEKVVALTFDGGSDLGYAGLVIDTLAAQGVQASFGITGEFARAHPDTVRRMAREGHEVMNHSDQHYSFTGVSSNEVLLTRAARQADLRAADAELAALIGHSTIPYWRPPFGDFDAGVLADVGAIGYGVTVMWTFDSLGWQGLSEDAIVARVLSRAEPGAIIVMHLGSQSQDGPALDCIIDGLRARGYRFTTVFNGLPRS